MNWKEKFKQRFGQRPLVIEYPDSLPRQDERENIQNFIQTEIIEKLIEEISPLQWSNLSLSGIKEAKQQLRVKWLN